MSSPESQNSISSMYDLLLCSQSSPLLGLRDIWEKELVLKLDEIWWRDALHRINSTCVCARMSLIQCKVVYRLHYTSFRLKKLFSWYR